LLLARTRQLVKQAQHMMNGHEFQRAAFLLGEAYESTRDHGDPTESAHFSPRIRHRIGQVVTHFEGCHEGTKHFDMAESLFDRGNVIGRAITLRDYGWSLWQEGDYLTAVTRLEQALDLFDDKTPETDQRYQLERLVTEGMLARTHAYTRHDALELQLHVDEVASSSNKLVYVLDNLKAMQPMLSGRDRWVAQARIVRTRSLILAKNEFSDVTDDLMDGRLVEATTGPALRTVRRLRALS